MATNTAVTLPEIEGIQPKRRSLGQLKALLTRQLQVARCKAKMANPTGDGSQLHLNTPMIELLQESLREIELAFKRWSLRLDQLIAEDPSPENQEEYSTKWNTVSKEFFDTENLIIHTIPNDNPAAPTQVPQQDDAPYFKPIESLKPFKLEVETSPSKFRIWSKRFESFYFASGLDKSRPITQQAFFRQCLTAELSSLIDSKITDDLEVFSSNEDGNSCIAILKLFMEKQNPIQLRRLHLFQTKQLPGEDFGSFVATLQKHQENADLANFTEDSIMGFLLLAGLNDPEILKEILEKSPAPSFADMIRIGSSIEITRSVIDRMHGTESTVKKIKSICKFCGNKSCSEPCKAKYKICFKCGEQGHLKKCCDNFSVHNSSNSRSNDNNSGSNSSSEESENELDDEPQEAESQSHPNLCNLLSTL